MARHHEGIHHFADVIRARTDCSPPIDRTNVSILSVRWFVLFFRVYTSRRGGGVIERVNERRMEEGEREKIQYNKDKKREEEKRRGGGCVKATDL